MARMELKFIAAVYLFMFVFSVSALDLNYEEECDSTNTDSQCDKSAFLECVMEYEGDKNGTCLCPNGSHWEPLPLSGKSECRKNNGTYCTDGENQMKCALNAKCNANVCGCDEGFVLSKNPSYHPLQICVGTHDTDCGPYPEVPFSQKRCDAINGLACNETTFKCSCGRKLWSASRRKCLTKIQDPEELCSNNDDCIKNAICVGRKCTCGSGYSEGTDNTCYVSHGNPCGGTISTVCNKDELTECSANDRCECPAGMRYKVTDGIGNCTHLLREGECTNNSTCYAGFCHSETEKCLCPFGQLEVSDAECATMSGDHGDYCTGNENCLNKNFMTCGMNATGQPHYGRCECEVGLFYENGECRVKADDDCSENGNCVNNAECLESNCKCSENTMISGDKFCHISEVSLPCNSSNPCSHEVGLICGTRCECPEGQIWEYSETAEMFRCVALVSGNCSVSSSYCTANSICTNAGICECNVGFSATPIDASTGEDRRCLRAHNSTCDADAEQYCNRYDFLSCSENWRCECILPLQQIYDEEVGKCLSVSQGFCGKLDENDFNQSCAKHSKCLPDLQGIFRCECDQQGVAAGAICPDPNAVESKGVKTSDISFILLLIFSFSCIVMQI